MTTEEEMANKIKELIEERRILDEKRGNGITLEKNEYVGNRLAYIEEQITKLKTPKI